MKKNLLFFVAAMGMLALTSCSQDTMEKANNDSNISIKFRPSINGMTRASITTINNLNAFCVTGYIKEENYYRRYFTDWEIKKKGDTWKPDYNRFWPPASDTLCVYAYAPTKSALNGEPIISFYGKYIDFKVESREKKQQDLIVAYQKGTRNTANFESNGISLNFMHALSKIDIFLKNAKIDDYEIKVRGVMLSGLSSEARFVYPKAASVRKLSANNWINLKNEMGCYADCDEGVIGDYFRSFMSEYFMVIPQKYDPWKKTTYKKGAYVGVLVCISKKVNGNKVQIYPKTKDKFAYVAVPIDTALEPGRSYVFRLTFMKNGAGYIAPDQSHPDKPTYIETKPGTGGEEILGGPISFTVTNEEWNSEIRNQDF